MNRTPNRSAFYWPAPGSHTRTHSPAIAIAATLIGLPLSLAAQDEPGFVREHAAFVVVADYATNPNGVEIDNTAGVENGLSYETFLERLAIAYAEGRGGVINFENPLYGDNLRLPDRRRVRGFINDYLDSNPQGDQHELIVQARELAETATFQGEPVVKENLILTENRLDPVSLLNPDLALTAGLLRFNDEPFFNDEIRFDDVLALYGPNNREVLRIDRLKERSIQEGSLATRDRPGRESRGLINDNYFMAVGNLGTAWAPISGTSALGGHPTVFDFALDPRDNVQVLAFTVLSFGNFQFWQGLNAFDNPENPDNVLVTARFSNGTQQLFTATTQQLSGGWDNFFAIEAPDGAAIAGLYIRIVGRNFRTFTRLDDVAFIVEPAPPYVASFTTIQGAAGNPLYYLLETAKRPTAVSISGLPPGLEFDEASGLISGTPVSPGEYTATVLLSSEVANVQTQLTFQIGPATAATAFPQITNGGNLTAVLGRDLIPFKIATTLDETELDDGVSYFFIPYKQTDTGEELTSLANMGLSGSSGVISGTPRLASQVGTYRVEVYATHPNGGDMATLDLSIFPPVPLPNFDANTTTDIAIRDGSNIDILLNPEAPPVTAITDLPASAQLLLGDFDGDNRTDFFCHDPQSGKVDLYFINGTHATKAPLFTLAPGTAWRALESRDLDGDGLSDIIWQNADDGAFVLWQMVGTDIRWAGFLRNDGVQRDLIATGDFDGSGTADFLWRRTDGLYEFFALEALRTDGNISGATEIFSRPDNATVADSADLNGDGIVDLIWRDDAGAFYAWLMEEAAVPSTFRPKEAAQPIPADNGNPLIGRTSLSLVGNADLDNNQRSDLLFADPNTGALHARLLGVDFLPVPAFRADGVTRRPAILRDQTTGRLVSRISFALILDAYPKPGQPLPLADNEALVDYTVYRQARDTAGNLLWTYQDFFALPVADTSQPVSVGNQVKNALRDGYPLPGEALSDYHLYQRAGENADGSPAPRRHPTTGVPIRFPRERPVADLSTPDFVWKPKVDGVPYGASGLRGFLAQRDLFGKPLLDNNGNPILVRWPENTEIPVMEGNIPWDLDREFSLDNAFRPLLPHNTPYRLAASGDFNADNNLDLLIEHLGNGSISILLMDGLDIIGVINPPETAIRDGVLTPRKPSAAPEPAAPWKFSHWFGSYQENNYPWILHEDLGWLHASNEIDQAQWLYSLQLGWFYADPTLFPHVYSLTHQWLWLARHPALTLYGILPAYAYEGSQWLGL